MTEVLLIVTALVPVYGDRFLVVGLTDAGELSGEEEVVGPGMVSAFVELGVAGREALSVPVR